MANVVQLDLYDPIEEIDGPLVDVDLDQLTPIARALAESIASTALSTRTTIWLQSRRTLRQLAEDDEAHGLAGTLARFEFWYTPEHLELPHRIPWGAWSHYPQTSTLTPVEYLEREAQKLPIGYYPIGTSPLDRIVPSARAAADDQEWLTRDQVLALLTESRRGRALPEIKMSTFSGYVSRDQAPAAGKYVGRTPLWDRQVIEAWAVRDDETEPAACAENGGA
jgi:hypothetical protein